MDVKNPPIGAAAAVFFHNGSNLIIEGYSADDVAAKLSEAGTDVFATFPLAAKPVGGVNPRHVAFVVPALMKAQPQMPGTAAPKK